MEPKLKAQSSKAQVSMSQYFVQHHSGPRLAQLGTALRVQGDARWSSPRNMIGAIERISPQTSKGRLIGRYNERKAMELILARE
jgi:hypothetical protein